MMTMWFVYALISLIVVIILFTLYTTRRFNHWKRKNVVQLKPLPIVGSMYDVFSLKMCIGEFLKKVYLKTDERFIGLYVCDQPALLIRDPELVKIMLVKDFEHFNDHYVTENVEDDPLGSNILFILKNPVWKDVRQKVTPIFTSGKMKAMYQLICKSGEDVLEYLKANIDENPVQEVKDICAKYSTDVISSTAFGINANCFINEEAEFRKVSKRILNWDIFERGFSTLCYFVAPRLVKLFHLRFVDKESSDFLRNAFCDTMRTREKSQFVRNDLLDILIQMKNEENDDGSYKLEDDVLIAQAVMFFMAGFESSSAILTFALYELSKNQQFQRKLREDVRNIYLKTKKFTYDSLKEMSYLEMCIEETLRKYPNLPFLDRCCTKDYQIPGTDVIIEKGTPVFFSNMGFHYDPKYFPDPNNYNPENFNEQNKKNHVPFTYLPFGAGPRNCIGARFGKLTALSALAHIILHFQVDVCEETPNEIKFHSKGFLLKPKKDIKLKFTLLNTAL